MTHYLALDIETTGPGAIRHRMVAFGAAVVDVASGAVVSDFRALLALGDHSDGRPYGWDERTYNEFWIKRENGKTPLETLRVLYGDGDPESERGAMVRFVEWARAHFDTFADMVIIVDTAAFDTTFLNVALDRHTDVHNLLYMRGPDKYRPVRDVSSFHMGVGRQTPAQGLFGSEKAALAALALADDVLPAKTSHDHDPRNDATYIGKSAAVIARAIERKSKRLRT